MNGGNSDKRIPDTFCIEVARLYQFRKMYPSSNPNLIAAADRVGKLISSHGKPIRFSRLGLQFFVEDTVIANPSKQIVKLFDAFSENRWESVRFSPDIGGDGILRVLERMESGQTGAYASKGFAGGNFSVGDKEVSAANLVKEGAGYLALVPMAQELLEEVSTGKKGAWARAHDIIRTLTDYTMSGSDLFGIISNLKDYDEYTFTHAINVSMLSATMAKSLQVADRVVDAIALGGLCHDIGKRTIPHDVLRKPEKLNTEERAMMDRHPVEGAAIIMLNPGLSPPLVPVIAFQHHMRPNGGGYPSLPVPSLPHPASMLVSVADTFDALRTVRPYQTNAYTQARSLSILLDLADTGVHHRLFVSVLARLLNVLTPGRKVVLSNGVSATIISEGEFDILTPLVESDDMEILDLSIPGNPVIKEVLD